ncbi:S9 family peptidase, partial [Steroidobacter sp.]|uniref:S9 family peptidase n=1 Tax=Steroidobacter sp. TaxID=1978227 RepID=UPI001A4F659A
SPAWSPDGAQIAFVSNRQPDWDRHDNTDIWVVAARAGSTPRQISTFEGADYGPIAWSPDGRRVAYAQGTPTKYSQYPFQQIAIAPLNGGHVVLPTAALDRDTTLPRFSEDGRFVDFLIADSLSGQLGRVAIGGGPVQRLIAGDRTVGSFSRAAKRTAVLITDSHTPKEIYAWEQGRLRQLTHHNRDWLQNVEFGAAERIEFSGVDGVPVHALLIKPPGYRAGQKYPLITWIHGGSYARDGFGFYLDMQLFAARGYVVLQVNYRGSSGRGVEFGRGIHADWGNKDRTDVLAGVDYLVAQGIADPDRLGVGGWSYGGILTNYIIAKDTRFKAAISGAGFGNLLSHYGTSEHIVQLDAELARPWDNPQQWLDLSYPFFSANRIRTPTLYVSGQNDFNVPVAGSEQMYQALKSLGTPTQLVIYPNETHRIGKSSVRRDLLERYLAWYARYLQG